MIPWEKIFEHENHLFSFFEQWEKTGEKIYFSIKKCSIGFKPFPFDRSYQLWKNCQTDFWNSICEKKDIQVWIFCFENKILHVLTPSWILIIFIVRSFFSISFFKFNFYNEKKIFEHKLTNNSKIFSILFGRFFLFVISKLNKNSKFCMASYYIQFSTNIKLFTIECDK